MTRRLYMFTGISFILFAIAGLLLDLGVFGWIIGVIP